MRFNQPLFSLYLAVTSALFLAADTGCGRVGFDFAGRDGGRADAGNDGGGEDAGADGGLDGGADGGGDAGLLACLVGTATYPTVQSALDDASCPVVNVSAGTFIENLSVARAVKLVGAGVASTALSGGGVGRTLTVTAAGDLTLEDLLVTGGAAAVGAGIDASGPLRLVRTRVTGNAGVGVDVAGAGIAAHAVDVNLDAGVEVIANTLTASGGAAAGLRARGAGVFIEGAGELTLSGGASVSLNEIEATLDGGAADIRGGGIAVADGATLRATSGWSVSENRIELVATLSNSLASNFSGGGVDCQNAATAVFAGGVVSSNAILAPSTQPFQYIARGGGLAFDNCDVNFAFGATSVADNSVEATSEVSGGGIDLFNSVAVFSGFSITGNVARATWPLALVSTPYAFGGGFHVRAGTVVLNVSVITANVAEAIGVPTGGMGVGGGVGVTAATSGATTLSLSDCQIGAGNEALASSVMGVGALASGGGLGLVDAFGSDAMDVFVVNSTISSNRVEATGPNTVDRIYGAGVAVTRTMNTPVDVRLIHSTIASNAANGVAAGSTHGGGVAATSPTMNSLLTLQNTIVHGNTVQNGADVDCWTSGARVSINAGAFIGDDTGCGGNLMNATIGVDPILGPLQDNGGPTHTHAIDPASPARDTAPAAGCQSADGSPLMLDQRRFARDASCDHGAYEVQ